MLGSSRNSFEAAREALAGRGSAVDITLAEELLAVANALAGSATLRNALSDSGSEVHTRTSVAESVFGGKVSATTLEVVSDAVGRRWTRARDLVDGIEGLAFESAFAVAEREGRLDTVEDELFRVDRIVDGSNELRSVLSDPSADPATHAEMLGGLLQGKVDGITAMLVRHVVQNPRGRRLGEALRELVEQSARRRERLLAEVKVAAPLTEQQSERLAAVLGRIYHRTVDLQVEVDPSLLGGVVVRVGGEVIDGSVAHRLEEVRRRLSA